MKPVVEVREDAEDAGGRVAAIRSDIDEDLPPTRGEYGKRSEDPILISFATNKQNLLALENFESFIGTHALTLTYRRFDRWVSSQLIMVINWI
jgi:hypothetical protein